MATLGELGITVHRATGLRSVFPKTVEEIVRESLKAEGAYVQLSLSGAGAGLHKSVSETNVAIQVDNTATWDHVAYVPIRPEYLECALVFQAFHAETRYGYPIGQVRITVAKFLDDDASGEKISYPLLTRSGKEKAQLIISHKFSRIQQKIDSMGIGMDEVAPAAAPAAEESPKKKKCGFAKRVAEKIAASALVAGITAAISCVIGAAQE